MKVLMISLGRNILDTESREHIRMREYADAVEELHIVVLTRAEHGTYQDLHEGNLHVYPTQGSTRFSMVLRALHLGYRVIRKNQTTPLVVSAQDPLEIGWMCALLSLLPRTRLHVQVHGDYFSSDAWVDGSVVRRVRRFFAYILLRTAPRIRVVSYRIKHSLLARGISGEKITVLPIRPEIEDFYATPRVQEERPCTFLFIGRLAKEKDIPRIVDAFHLLYETEKNICLRIVGSGSEKETIESQIRALHLEHVVEMVPWSMSVAHEMARADIFLLASKHEAYGLTLVEALAVGLPVVTTEVGCVGEVVTEKHGIVVRESGVTPYMEAMRLLLTDPARRAICSDEGRKTARTLIENSKEAYVQSWVTALIGGKDRV